MAWFLSQSKKGGKTKRKRGADKAASSVLARPWDPQRTLTGLKVFAAAGLMIIMVLGWQRAETALRGYVADHQAVSVDPDDVILVNVPAWTSNLLRQQIQEQVAFHADGNPLNRDALMDVAVALTENPWIASVNRIRRLPGGRIEVTANYREPIALVESSDGFHLVDPLGVRLPGLYLRNQVDRLGIPVIVGVRESPYAVGRIWPGNDLQAGLALVQTLTGERYIDQISAIDVSRRDNLGRIRLALLTRTGGLVRWGLPPGEEHPVEPDAAIKKQWLNSVDYQRGSIDAGGKMVDVYGAAVFIHPTPGREAAASVGYTLAR